MKRIVNTLVFSLWACAVLAQSNMEKGFQLLEQGNFGQAEQFFADFLHTSPDNKTAQICFGRAVGLNGRPEVAIEQFRTLLENHPTDLEVRLNYNESLLWDQRYDEAKPLYANLVTKHPEAFAAVLGYANTLSNLKEYKAALQWVERALQLQPNNTNAKTSKKYILLGYVNQYINQQQYDEGESLLKEIFIDFPEDRETLLNLANLYLIKKDVQNARDTYGRMAVSPKDSITAYNGIALAEHIGENDKEALEVATQSLRKVSQFRDFELTERTYNRYVQALIWNRKFVNARKMIDSLSSQHPNRDWILALSATLGLYTGNAKQSIADYNQILALDSTSFDGNLGKANALFATGRMEEAYAAAKKTLEFYPNQKDALQFIEKIELIHRPAVSEHAGYTFDNGNNVAVFTNTTVELPFSTKFRTTVSYGYRTTENTITGNKADAHTLQAGLQYKLWSKTLLKTTLGLNASQFMGESYTQPLINAQLQWQPFRLQNASIGYQREVQNFNADLIAREIVQNQYQLTYNLGTNFGLGWYTQMMHTEQSDANRRDLLFISVYYNVFRKPALKLGLNYQFMAFADQVPELYFSPERYQAVEVFADLRGKIAGKTGYMFNGALGQQQVEDDPYTTAFRLEAGFQHQFSKRVGLDVYGKYSNIASATAAGFEFTEIGFKLRWLFTQKALFQMNP